MSILQISTLFFLFSIIPLSIATNLPTTVIGAEQFDMEACIEQNTNDCLEAVCINPSPADCATECKEDAENKCQALAGQRL